MCSAHAWLYIRPYTQATAAIDSIYPVVGPENINSVSKMAEETVSVETNSIHSEEDLQRLIELETWSDFDTEERRVEDDSRSDEHSYGEQEVASYIIKIMKKYRCHLA